MITEHTCHATGCTKAVPPKLFMCYSHWKRLPKKMQAAVWAEYTPGQEVRKDPTRAYFSVTKDAIRHIEKLEGLVAERTLF